MDSEAEQANQREKVLGDASLFRCLQKEGVNVSDIAAVLGCGRVKLYTTGCTITELADNHGKQKPDVSKALKSAMDAIDVSCGHGDAGLSSVDCIEEFLRGTKSQQFIVATDSDVLQQKIKLLPGIRFISFEGGVFYLKNSRQESDPSNSLSLKRSREVSSVVALGSNEIKTDMRPIKIPRSNLEVENQANQREKVLGDASLFRCLQKEGVNVSDIAAVLGCGRVKLYTTGCTITELADNHGKQKPDVSKALKSAMDAIDVSCGHGDAGLSSVDCIEDFLRGTKSQQFIVATDSEVLQQKIKLLPGIRFIGFEGGVFYLKNSRQESDPSNSLSLKRSREVSSVVALGSNEMKRSNFDDQNRGPFTIFVVGFGVDADLHVVRNTLRRHFASCGQITRVFIPKNKFGALKDIAFLDFSEKSAFNKALKLTRTELNGDIITVEPARPFQGSGDGGTAEASSGSDSETDSFDDELPAVKFGSAEDSEGQDKTWRIFVVGFGSNGEYISDRAALRAHFSVCGHITRIFVPKDKRFGFVDFNDETAFHKALELNRTEVNGETIAVEPARCQGGRGPQA